MISNLYRKEEFEIEKINIRCENRYVWSKKEKTFQITKYEPNVENANNIKWCFYNPDFPISDDIPFFTNKNVNVGYFIDKLGNEHEYYLEDINKKSREHIENSIGRKCQIKYILNRPISLEIDGLKIDLSK